jgi:hypothetical protein
MYRELSNTICPPPLPMPQHVHIDFVVPLPGCGRSETDFWGWGVHRAQLRCPDDVSDDMYERGVPGGALNLNSTGYPHHGRYGDLPLQGKISTAEPGIFFRTRDLMVSSQKFWPPSHEAGRSATVGTLLWLLNSECGGNTILRNHGKCLTFHTTLIPEELNVRFTFYCKNEKREFLFIG